MPLAPACQRTATGTQLSSAVLGMPIGTLRCLQALTCDQQGPRPACDSHVLQPCHSAPLAGQGATEAVV